MSATLMEMQTDHAAPADVPPADAPPADPPPARPVPDARLPRFLADLRGNLPLIIVLALMLVPIWSFRYFPSTDGGSHVANADVLLHYFRADGAAYRTFYRLNYRPLPNTAGHLALVPLLMVFAPPTAEKILVSLIVLLFPLTLRYAARGIHIGSGYLAWLALPLSIGFMLHEGFYNFCLGVCAFFVLIGYWVRYRENLTLRRAAVVTLLSLLLYACHLFTIAMGCLAIGVLAIWLTGVEAWAHWKQGERDRMRLLRVLWPGIRSRCVMTLAALIPAILLAAKFRFVGRPEAAVRHGAWLSLPFWKNLLGLGILFSYRLPELKVGEALAALLGVVLVGLVAMKLFRRHYSPYDGLLIFVGMLVMLYFTKADDASKAIYLPERLILFIWIGAILWIAAQPVGFWRKRLLQAGAGVAALALSALHFQSYAALNPQIMEYTAAADQITPGSTLLPLVFMQCGSPPACDMRLNRPTVVPFYMTAGYVTARLKAIDLRNYEAALDYFPVCFRDDVNPDEKLSVDHRKGFNDIPQRVDIPGYRERTGGRAQVDYVLLFPSPKFLDARMMANTDMLSIQRQLDDGFDLIYTSPGRGLAQLWRRKDWNK